MIIGPDFVWMHFPKCAGSSFTEAMENALSHRDDVHIDPKDQSNVIWHHTVEKRRAYDSTFSPEGKRIICGIRRLPTWLLSKTHFEAQRPPDYHITPRELLMQGRFIENDGRVGWADGYMRGFTAWPVDAWIRIENFASDAIKAFSGTSIEAEIRAADFTAKSNVSRIRYLADTRFYFTPEELRALYAKCPVWTKMERAAYSDTIADRFNVE